uniref:Rhodanese domain-containing protein n=1 Tax=Mycena chlorophos TaxID=658473 RepID=A0ABQ0LDF7_MYCCL|nr:predicted protein [Mycena chlorophos]
MSRLLLSPTQLQKLLRSNTKTVVLDSTWFMPNSPRVAKAEFKAKRIPGAQFLDLDEVASSHPLGLKHMLPSPKTFANACGAFGMERSSTAVFYDAHGVFSSPRALWMFKQAFGHENAAILDGGLPRWEAEGFPVDTNPEVAAPVPATYSTPTLDALATRSYEQMVDNAAKHSPARELVMDARSRGRFLGTDPEPRPGLSSGHMPHSVSLPFNVFLRNHVASNGSPYTTFLPEDQLRSALEEAIGSERLSQAVLQGQQPVITSCGSGMTAAILWLGLQLLGVKNTSLYDESWTGYALRPSSIIEKSG